MWKLTKALNSWFSNRVPPTFKWNAFQVQQKSSANQWKRFAQQTPQGVLALNGAHSVIGGGYSDVTVVGGCHPTKRHESYIALDGIHIYMAFSSLSVPHVQSVVIMPTGYVDLYINIKEKCVWSSLSYIRV